MIPHMTRAQYESVFTQVLGDRLPGQPEQAIYEQSALQRYVLGAEMKIGPDKYRYGQAGAVALAAGKLMQSPVPVATHINLVPDLAYGIGTRIIGVVAPAVAITADQYAGGILFINAGTGLGQTLHVITNTAATVGLTAYFTCVEALTVALVVANSKISLVANPYAGIIVHPAPPTARLAGVPLVAVDIGYFVWFKVRGLAAVLTDGTIYLGREVAPSGGVDVAGTAGAVKHACMNFRTGSTAAAACGNGALVETSVPAESAVRFANSAVDTDYDLGPLQSIVGRVVRVLATAEYSLIDLKID